MKRWLLVFAVLLATAGFARAEAIRSEDFSALVPLTLEQESLASRLNGMLKCPVCRNQSLASSSSFIAEEMKREIRKMVAAGKTETQIQQFYVDRYTDWILLAPPAKGLNWGLYAVPVILLVLGLIMVIRWLRNQDKVEIAKPDQGEAPDEDALARARDLVEKELSL